MQQNCPFTSRKLTLRNSTCVRPIRYVCPYPADLFLTDSHPERTTPGAHTYQLVFHATWAVSGIAHSRSDQILPAPCFREEVWKITRTHETDGSVNKAASLKDARDDFSDPPPTAPAASAAFSAPRSNASDRNRTKAIQWIWPEIIWCSVR